MARETHTQTPKRCGWGGRREGAGRKPKLPHQVPHRARPALASRHPVEVRLTVDESLPSLRGDDLRPHVEECLRRGKEREGFRLVHYSIQRDHLHLIVEAKSARALSSGVEGLNIRIARRINRLLGRRGRFFSQRYAHRVLKTPEQTRAALIDVLLDARRHAAEQGLQLPAGWIDECSSARTFDGWIDGPPPRPAAESDPAAEVALPHSWLLSSGWRQQGLISVDTVPSRPCRFRGIDPIDRVAKMGKLR